MVRRHAVSILSALFMAALFCSPALAAEEKAKPKRTDFMYHMPILGSQKKNVYYKIPVPYDVIRRAAADLRDVRILSRVGMEIPYIVSDETIGENAARYDFKIVSYDEPNPGASIITMKVPDAGAPQRPIGLMDFETNARDFRKSVRIHCMPHGRAAWELAAEDAIFDFTSQVDLRKTRMEFSPRTCALWRVELIDAPLNKAAAGDSIRLKYKDLDFTARDQSPARMKINRVTGSTQNGRDGVKRMHEDLGLVDFISSTDAEGRSYIIFESGIVFTKIIFDPSAPYYYRSVSVYGGEKADAKDWDLIGGGHIYKFPVYGHMTVNNIIELNGVGKKYEYVKIVIDNRDSPALEIKGIRLNWPKRVLYFSAIDNSGGYGLYFGSPNLKSPSYDISVISEESIKMMNPETLMLGGRVENADYSPAMTGDMRRRIERTALTVIVILAALGMAWWMFALIRKSKTGE